MTLTCIPSTSYFSTPEFLIRSTHIITAISFPIHILGLYIILFKTPKQMSSVKWYFVNLHFWIVIYDNSLGFLTVPYLLLPTMSGYILGVLKYTGISEYYMVVLVLLTCINVLLSVLTIFENRFFIICDFFWKPYWNKIRKPWIGFHFVFGMIIFIPMKFLIPDQEISRKKVFETLPCVSDYVRDAPVFVLTDDYTYHLIGLVSLLVTGTIEGGFFIDCLIFFIIRQLKSKRMSRVTIKLQVKFLVALTIQMTIPTLMMIIPLTYSWVAIVYDYYNQTIMNIVIAIETTHGLLSTLTMIFIHHPYRTAFLKMIFKCKRKPKEESFSQHVQRGSVFPTQN